MKLTLTLNIDKVKAKKQKSIKKYFKQMGPKSEQMWLSCYLMKQILKLIQRNEERYFIITKGIIN